MLTDPNGQPVNPARQSAVAERSVYWTRYRVNGTFCLYFVTSAGEWYGFFQPMPGETDAQAEERIWRLLEQTDPADRIRPPALRIV